MRPCSGIVPFMLLALACATQAVKIELPPGSRQCTSDTFPQAAASAKPAQPLLFTATLRVFGGGSADGGGTDNRVAASVQDPQGSTIVQQQTLPSHAELAAPAAGYGKYTLCLTNAANSRVVVDVQRFALASSGSGPSGGGSGDNGSSQAQSQLSPVHEQVLWLQNLLRQLQAEQHAMRERLDRHFATNVDTSRRTLHYSLAEVAALLVTTFLQVVAIQCFFRRHSDTISRRLSVQALAQRSDEVHVQLAEQSPGVSFTQGSASGVSFTQGSASSGSRLTRSFSRRRLGSESNELDGVAVDLFGSPASDGKTHMTRRWGSSGSISQLAFPVAAPSTVAEESASRDPATGHWSAEALPLPLRRHSSQAERLLRPVDASPPTWQRLPQLQPFAGSPAVALPPPSDPPPSDFVAQQTPLLQHLPLHAVWQQPSGAWESVARYLSRSGSAASIESLEGP